ncbi:MAG: FKBP-type peptidyl-prolyl cis-trans isomerase SlyD [Myxococcota bacterium]|jgi:FKBP-type peptidyl-prolyl cis-trans isomerase SlyD
MQIEENSVVSMHYKLANSDGDVIDSSEGADPLTYLHGNGQLVPGVEKALTGKAPGDKFDVVVPCTEGYGERDPRLDLAISPDSFPEDARADLAPGLQFHSDHPDGGDDHVMFTVVDVQPDRILATGNHQLAGVELHFSIEVADVRAATAKELEHGHVHGPGGHEH